ncbi:uncharacterized protein LOC100838109 [Brachypodium distachyon]|uniref:Histone-lysine N-methyltransferase ASHH2 n=1 Tax=Brachypodium distachyon TaxID=15368 RepID=I1IAH5_BRADI|nr:uncharacterized protein LOC100838109 [Brachypodium distachyon]KQJ99871.1 hypothetical protein BRADI_3g45727v3 [Brachypodium distachyon]PNT68823.1 hypothetical protein BRADI_3g45727v3 [Brachypodium distachyon]PNT68824.1 hypothetical protein BRADI_3g45727v3 [Brachypodium distachyon]PNT68825.1 hypothetical protein BRADI_3g45727v3 [Brachypodium distachyon]PNT68826.1 hypothetical protein BRADI_3g45727v3 [Brachypodium distachyon]|eukprot:XP_003575133.2 uncharacterized protein LOC100838109 [Brachypodium distachyon]
MKEAGADGRSWEDHLATARLNGEAKAAAPQVGHGLGADKACAMSTEEDEEKDKGCNLAVKLEESVEAISPPFEVRGRISEEKGSSMEERPLNMDEEKTCNFLVESAESGNLQTCYGANGRVLSKALCITCGDTLCSKDVGCVRGSVDKVTERSQYELGGLVCNGGLSDSIKHDADRCPNGVDDIIFMTDDNYELSQDDLMLKIEAEASGQLLEDSVPSVSGSIDVSLNGKAGQCEEDVLCNGALGKTSLEDVQLRCMKPHCGDGSLPDPVKFDIQQLPHDMDVTRLKKYVNQLDEDGLLQKIGAEVSIPVREDSVPSNFGIGEISEHKTGMEKVACGSMGFFGVLSCEGGFWKEALEDENQSPRMDAKAREDNLQTCWVETCHGNGSLSDLRESDSENLPCGANGPSLMIDANHELEKGVFLPSIDADLSLPVYEASLHSVNDRPMDVPVNGTSGWIGELSTNRTCVEKLKYESLGEGTLLCENEVGFQTEASVNARMGIAKDPISSICKDEIMESSEACGPFPEIKVPLQHQQTDQKHETVDLPLERDLIRSSYNQPWEDEPFHSCKGSSAPCLGHRDTSGVKLGSPDHLAQELNTCNSAIDKPCSADFVENGNDGELQNQTSESLNVFRRRNPRRAASSRINLEKHDQINKGSKNIRKSKKIKRSWSLVESTMIKFPNKTTKGRSGINRPPKSTGWGCLQKLTDGFSQNCGPSTSNSHLTYIEKGRSNTRSEDKKQPSIRKTRSLRGSRNKCPALSDIGYALDEVNGESAFLATTGTNAPSEGYIGNFPKLVPDSLVNVSCDARKTAQYMSIQTEMQQLDTHLESVTQETCPTYIHGQFAKSTSEPSLNNSGVGFSPDSVLEVASVTCENNTSASHDVTLRENTSYPAALAGDCLHASTLSSFDFQKNHASSSTDLEQCTKNVKGDENTRKEEMNPSHARIGNGIGEVKVQCLEMSNAVRRSKNLRKQECQKKDGIKGNNMKNISSTKIPSSEASKLRASFNDSSSLGPSELLLSTGPAKFGSCFEVITSATQDLSLHEHNSMQGPSVTGSVRDPNAKGKNKMKNIADDVFLDPVSSTLPYQLVTDLAGSHMNEQSNHSPATERAFKNSAALALELPRNAACKKDGTSLPQPVRSAWVCCDDCQKWRCIPAELADTIGETNCRWTCKDNRDNAFADCSIPQEKTNAEINAELELSDASADEADNDGSNSKASRAPSWTAVKTNSFLHRNRRTQSIDESMVCNCKPPQDGRMGCRDGCLNRMLNIECTKRTCPCGEYCSNQQFQRRSYAKISWFCSGKKGFGLQLKEEVTEGRFLIEYVGEVLDITAYECRQRYYASKGQKHFYFMALNGGEVIDACTKGNLGRFINHSCSPNCRTEKWMVNGEVCIGIFAMRNIKKGEELTFDYNYVRVSGAAPQKCFCGTAKCRGYIGGDISGSGIIAQDNAGAEHFETLAADKDAEEMLANGACSHGVNPNIAEHGTSIQSEDLNDCAPASPESEPHQETSLILFDTSEPEYSLEALSPQDSEEITRTPVHVSQTENSLQQFPVHDTQPLDILQKTRNTMDLQFPVYDTQPLDTKAPNAMIGSTPSSDLGSNLVPSFHANKKDNLKRRRNVKPSLSPIDNEHALGVEGTLNNLLDRDGGISKRKDSANGYLKLLVLTAAEGDNAGGTSKSVRDLSLILDALLKTKSSSVLLDIINKNGLQMLHNILKQNRDNFHRTPILRKLLKVLEFLASKEILTPGDINAGPRCAGMESFRDSMLSLASRHSDVQVYKIARKFRDDWITPYIAGPVSTSNCSTDSYFTRRKHKSRWDYQPESHYRMVGLQVQKVYSRHGELDLQTGLKRNRSQGNWANIYNDDAPVMGRSTDGADDEVPPGFEPQQEHGPAQASLDWGADDEVPPGFEPQQKQQPAQASLDCGVAPGFCQERYLPHLSISHGIPIALVQHLGTSEVEGGHGGEKWKVAPGMPFSPFPPLPTYPRGSPCPSTSSNQMSHHNGAPVMKHNSSEYMGRADGRGGRGHRNWRNGARTRFPYNQGRRFPSNHHRFERCQPPRPQEHGGSGFRGRE